MGLGPMCQTPLSTDLSEWELGPHHVEQSPIVSSYLGKNKHYQKTMKHYYVKAMEWEYLCVQHGNYECSD